MKFMTIDLEEEFETTLHPDVCHVLRSLDDWSLDNAIPQVVVTGLSRTPERNTEVGGVPRSWHLFGCAADLRSSHYTPTQKASVMSWLQRMCERPMWELLEHNVKTGLHLHIAKRDFSWRNTFPQPKGHA